MCDLKKETEEEEKKRKRREENMDGGDCCTNGEAHGDDLTGCERRKGEGRDVNGYRQRVRQPVVVVVVSTAAPHVKIPEWEQVLSAGAVCQNILLACAALGVGCQWNSGWIAYDGPVTAAMGLQPHEKVAGIMYFGTSAVELEDRPRPDAAAITTIWGK